MMTYTIGEVARETGLSIDTLRYYERIELVVDIERNSSGHRCYNADDLKWLNLLICLRTTGMPIADMQRFAQLVRGGDHTKPERITLLQAHREAVLKNMAQMQQRLSVIDGKINKYTQQVKG